MIRLIRAELFKLRKRQMTWNLLFILLGIIIVIHFLLLAVSKSGLPGGGGGDGSTIHELLGLKAAIPFALSTISTFGAVLAIILIASFVGNEYNWGTIRTELISCESRFKFLSAKLVSFAFVLLIGMLLGVIVGFGMGMVTTALGGYSFDFSFATGSYFWEQFLQFWRTFFIIIPYALLGFLFAILGRSAMPGIAMGIGLLFLEQIITGFMRLAGGWIANIPDYLLSANREAINALADLPQGFGFAGGGGNFTPPSVIHAFIVLTIYSLAFLALGYYLIKTRDVTG